MTVHRLRRRPETAQVRRGTTRYAAAPSERLLPCRHAPRRNLRSRMCCLYACTGFASSSVSNAIRFPKAPPPASALSSRAAAPPVATALGPARHAPPPWPAATSSASPPPAATPAVPPPPLPTRDPPTARLHPRPRPAADPHRAASTAAATAATAWFEPLQRPGTCTATSVCHAQRRYRRFRPQLYPHRRPRLPSRRPRLSPASPSRAAAAALPAQTAT